MERLNIKKQKGAALIELLIAVTVGGIMIIGSVALIAVTLRVSVQNKYFQSAAFLNQDLIEKVSIYAEREWICDDSSMNCGIYQLKKGSLNKYHLTASSSFKAVQDEEVITLNGIIFKRYFYVENVSRDSKGRIEENYESIREDPSTQKITVITTIPNGEVRFIRYLTRSENTVFIQTDWSGGSGFGPPKKYSADELIDVFDSHNNIKYDKRGSIEIMPI